MKLSSVYIVAAKRTAIGSNTVVTGGFESMSKAPFLLFNVLINLILRLVKAQVLGINNYTMLSAMTVFKMLLIRWQWEIVHRRQLMILR